jgi:hypothetical protein
MPFHYEEFDLSGVRTYPLKSRPSKARVEDFAKPVGASPGVGELLDTLPNVLAAADLKAVAGAVAQAARTDAGVVWGLGAHVIKTGLAPILVELMERGFVSAIATNGAAIIHDFEVALSGATSETSTRRSVRARSAWRMKRAAFSTEPLMTESLAAWASARRCRAISTSGARNTLDRACSPPQDASVFR